MQITDQWNLFPTYKIKGYIKYKLKEFFLPRTIFIKFKRLAQQRSDMALDDILSTICFAQPTKRTRCGETAVFFSRPYNRGDLGGEIECLRVGSKSQNPKS